MFTKCCLSCLLIYFLHMYFTLCLFHVCDPPSCSRPPFASENLFVGSVAAAAYNPPTSLPHLVFVDDNHINFSPVVVAVFLSLGLLSCSLFTAAYLVGLIHLLLIYPHKVIFIGKHGICSLIVWLGRLGSCPVFYFSKQFFSSISGSIANWMPIKSVSKKLVETVLVLLSRIV